MRTRDRMTTRQKLIVMTLGIAFQMLPQVSVRAQTRSDSGSVDKTFFTRRDAVLTGIAAAGTVAISVFDERIGHWTQTPSVQGDQSRRDLFDNLTHLNETPLTLGAIATYGIGRLIRSETVGDVGLHWTEAIVLNDVVSELIRGPLGRVRPRVSQDNAYKFDFGGGFTKFEDRSFPSLHSSSAFATAAALVGEVHERRPGATWVVAPILVRCREGSRYHTDVSQPALGERCRFGRVRRDASRRKEVHSAHTHRRNKLDRFLLGTTVVPVSGGFALAVSLKQ